MSDPSELLGQDNFNPHQYSDEYYSCWNWTKKESNFNKVQLTSQHPLPYQSKLLSNFQKVNFFQSVAFPRRYFAESQIR